MVRNRDEGNADISVSSVRGGRTLRGNVYGFKEDETNGSLRQSYSGKENLNSNNDTCDCRNSDDESIPPSSSPSPISTMS